MKLQTQAELLKLLSTANRIQDVSFATMKLRKENPIDRLTEEQAQELIEILLERIESLYRGLEEVLIDEN